MACKRGGEHQGDVDPVEVLSHRVGRGERVAEHVGKRPVVADRPAEHEGHPGAYALVQDARTQPTRPRRPRRWSRSAAPR